MPHESILTNPTDSELIGAVQQNLFALFQAMVDCLGGELDERDGLRRHLTFPSNPMFKGVWRARLSSHEADAAIDQTIAWFKERSAPFFFWWTGPGTAPGDLADRLQARGLVNMAEEIPGTIFKARGAPCMVADLHRMNEEVMRQTPPGFAIEEVRDESALGEFKRVLIEGYDIPEMMADGWVQASRRAGVGKTPWRLFLGRLNGEPVATNIVLNAAGVSGVYGIATAPAARRKGIGAAVTLGPLLKARESGYRHGVLWSTEMAIPVYERIGFRLTDARINRYLWRNT